MPIFVLQRGSVAISQKSFEPMFPFKFSNHLIESLAVQGLIIHSKRRVADTG